MATVITCDGCGAELRHPPLNRAKGQKERMIHGARDPGMAQGGFPPITFDWCAGCAHVAFDALAAKRGHRVLGADDESPEEG